MKMPPMVGFDSDYDKGASDTLAKVIQAGTGVIDLGAHAGHYSLLAARHVSSTGRVLAVEPSPTQFQQLCRNVWANGFRQVTPVCCAVSDKRGFSPLYFDGGNGGDDRLCLRQGENRQSIQVSTDTLDGLVVAFPEFATGVEFIKIDVQGMELAAIKGGHKFFASNHHLLALIEFSPLDLVTAGVSGRELLALLWQMGFTIAAGPSPAPDYKWTLLSEGEPVFEEPRFHTAVTNLLCMRGKYKSMAGG